MATINPTVLGFGGDSETQGVARQWALANTDVGAPIPFFSNADRSAQVEGTFGAGGTVLIEGSNDGVNYHTLRDPQGVLLSYAGADIRAVTEMTKWIRPRCSGGDGTTALVVTVCARRST